MLRSLSLLLVGLVIVARPSPVAAQAEPADIILHGGKVVAVDREFSRHSALAVRGARIVAVGADDDVLKLRGPDTRVVDLAGKMVLPGLIDSHVHSPGAALHEFDHPVPDIETIDDLLAYIRSRAAALEPGNWIVVRQIFITRLKERRYPTREELDRAAPEHPVLFSTGPDASVNSLALKLSGIDKDFQIVGTGLIERDPATGEPTGILRGATRYIKAQSASRSPTEQDRYDRLVELFHDYNRVGITGVVDRGASGDGVARYVRMEQRGDLTLRVACSRTVGTDRKTADIQAEIAKIGEDPLARRTDGLVRIIGIKIFLDGGMLTGSAYMRAPWGVSDIYSIRDPHYRGVRFVEPEPLRDIVRAAVEANLQFTAHSVGDGAVHALLDAYEEVNRTLPIAASRPCITHSNFMSREAVVQAARLGVSADIQPAWLYLDAETLRAQFGEERLRYFQPLATAFAEGMVVGGGSDHMQKIGSLRSINPYDPWLGMWVTLARLPRGGEQPLHPVEALTREQAIRYYTANNAHIMRQEREVGSLEVGKQADFIVIDRDLLTCPIDDVRTTRVLSTWMAGRQVSPRP